ncbi:sigma factor-like helix-turn-helix DNA-binding protein [Microbacterium sp.]|uniref:sigma factor-like helix-turn-helix DNA-binding protein n=1 Tax=Microbacterium sp. TaxID=51671 RepID=UPI0039E5758A
MLPEGRVPCRRHLPRGVRLGCRTRLWRVKACDLAAKVIARSGAKFVFRGVDIQAQRDPKLAELVTLVHWDGFTIAEAGLLQGVPASTARGRYQRARARLLALLSPSVGN